MIIEKQDILVLDERPTDGLDDTAVTVETKYSVNMTSFRGKIFLTLHYNATNSFFNANDKEIRQFKAKDSEIET